jgi:protein required for attachment to host cells
MEENGMLVPKGMLVAVIDGENFTVFENTGVAAEPRLKAMATPDLELTNFDGGKRHSTSGGGGNGNDRALEDAHVAAATDWLNHQAKTGKISELVIIADPRSLGEMRPRYHTTLKDCLRKELALGLATSPIPEIEKALVSA